MGRSAAEESRFVIEGFLGSDPPLHVTFWDGSAVGRDDAGLRVRVASPVALRRLLWAPNELGLARAYVSGDLDFDGSVFALLDLRDRIATGQRDVSLRLSPRERLRLMGTARRLGFLGLPPRPPSEEARLGGRLHTRRRDRQAISHHYDVGNEFYRLVLGPTMTYSCAYFPTPDTPLDVAQEAKYELICRKLGLDRHSRLLDVGCGWGGMVLHAARHHGARAVGVTISRAQAEEAVRRVEEAGVADRVEIRLCDYRDVDDGPYDAISSIGMFEHVGLARLKTYVGRLGRLLRPEGRLLNHAISRPSGRGALDPDSFVARYVFPDGELHEVGRVVSALQDDGLECRDVESLREHYGRTLRHWVANLEASWDEAVRLVGAPRARIWRLYMAGSAVGFEANRTSIHQVLAVRTADDGSSGMPPTRRSYAAVDVPVKRDHPVRRPFGEVVPRG